MDYWNFAAEIIGFVASALYLYSASLSDDKKLTFFYNLGCVVLATHLFMLSAYAGSGMVVLSAIRNVLIKRYNSPLLKQMFLGVFVLAFSYFCINHTYWHETLVPFASLIMAVGFIYLKGNGLSFALIASCSTWFVYGVEINSYAIMFLESATIVCVTIRMLKQNNIVDFGLLTKRLKISEFRKQKIAQ